mmetsp:Transcript_78544/g.220240  ORF Transcript_78544/g.220240 Transcript_78544/m.220240 type:complete len:258 (+) Transcript_78544:450-1223(+)
MASASAGTSAAAAPDVAGVQRSLEHAHKQLATFCGHSSAALRTVAAQRASRNAGPGLCCNFPRDQSAFAQHCALLSGSKLCTRSSNAAKAGERRRVAATLPLPLRAAERASVTSAALAWMELSSSECSCTISRTSSALAASARRRVSTGEAIGDAVAAAIAELVSTSAVSSGPGATEEEDGEEEEEASEDIDDGVELVEVVTAAVSCPHAAVKGRPSAVLQRTVARTPRERSSPRNSRSCRLRGASKPCASPAFVLL